MRLNLASAILYDWMEYYQVTMVDVQPTVQHIIKTKLTLLYARFGLAGIVVQGYFLLGWLPLFVYILSSNL